MDNEWLFRLILAALVIGIIIIRTYYRRLAGKTEGRVTQIEGRLNLLFRLVMGVAGLLMLLVQIIYPEALAGARLDLPGWARWLGVACGVGGLGMLLWVHEALRENFSGTLHIREQHTLITGGPYRWVRHPMYTSFYLLVAAFFLLSANGLIGLAWFGGLTLVMVTRIAREEAVIQEKFGDAYRAYIHQTGRFWPRLGA